MKQIIHLVTPRFILAASLGHGHSTPGAHGTTIFKSFPVLVMCVRDIFARRLNSPLFYVMWVLYARFRLKIHYLY